MGALARATDESERADAMEKLSAGVQRAIRLVEQLLSLARQGPRVEAMRQRVRLDELAREVVAEMVPVADARKIDLGISTLQPAYVLGDPDALRTLVRNLVDNALRYTPAGGTVDVSVQPSGKSGGMGAPPSIQNAPPGPGAPPSTQGAVLRVVDTGPGIAVEERQRVFDRFYRPPGTSPPGSGLGLAIVKAIADAHAALVSLDTGANGQGLAVTVSFPPS
jgi:two-component system OmpR family sensor kinase